MSQNYVIVVQVMYESSMTVVICTDSEPLLVCNGDGLTDEFRKESLWLMFADYFVIYRQEAEVKGKVYKREWRIAMFFWFGDS